jgi:hypothetical protein
LGEQTGVLPEADGICFENPPRCCSNTES